MPALRQWYCSYAAKNWYRYKYKWGPQSPEVPSVNVNGWPVAIVTPAAPAITAPGQTIPSKQNSQLVVANNDGTTSLVVP